MLRFRTTLPRVLALVAILAATSVTIPSTTGRSGKTSAFRPASRFGAASAFAPTFRFGPSSAWADTCPTEPQEQIYTGGGQVVCPCFGVDEEAGTVFTNIPNFKFPIEILRIGIGWASQFGGAPASLEHSIRVYPLGLPDPSSPIYTKTGPVLQDGFINEFNFEPDPGQMIVNSEPFTVTLKFQNENAGDAFAPSMVHDGNGCQSGKNVVYAIPGGWLNACAAGVSGDWIVYIIYRRLNCSATGVGDPEMAASVPAFLAPPRPNPFWSSTSIEFFVAREEQVTVSVFDLAGARVAELTSATYGPGTHLVPWDGRDEHGARIASGVYFVEMQAGEYRSTRKVIYRR